MKADLTPEQVSYKEKLLRFNHDTVHVWEEVEIVGGFTADWKRLYEMELERIAYQNKYFQQLAKERMKETK